MNEWMRLEMIIKGGVINLVPRAHMSACINLAKPNDHSIFGRFANVITLPR